MLTSVLLFATYYVVPAIIAAVFILYVVFVLPKLQQKMAAQATEHMKDFENRIKGREEEEKQRILSDPDLFQPIGLRLSDEKVIGITSCMEKRDFKDVLKQGLINGVGRMVGKTVGIGFRRTDNTDAYYLILTDKQLHYMMFDEKVCKHHLSFPLTNLADVKLENGGFKDSYTGGQQGAKKLTFKLNGKEEKLYYYEHIVKLPDSTLIAGLGKANNERAIVLGTLFLEPFKLGIESYVSSYNRPVLAHAS
jgi:hypothetical protein